MTLVPLNRKCFATFGCTDGALRSRYFKASSVSGVLETGTDSPGYAVSIPRDAGQVFAGYRPVSMLSLTIQSPDRSIESHGTKFKDGSENSKTSPGTSSSEETDRPVAASVSRGLPSKDDKYVAGWTHKIHFGEREHHIRRGIFLGADALSASILASQISGQYALKTYRSGFQHRRSDAEYRNEKDANCVVIVLIHGPEDQARDLEDIERMKGLGMVRKGKDEKHYQGH